MARNKLQTLKSTRVNQKKIRSSRKEYACEYALNFDQ